MKTLLRIIKIAIFAPLLIIFMLICAFIFSPLYHNVKAFRFNSSVSSLPLPNSTKLLAQENWVGHIWANGRHIDYLVVTLLESPLSSNEIVNHFSSPAIMNQVKYPITNSPKYSEFNLDIIKLDNDKLINTQNNSLYVNECEANIKQILQKYTPAAGLNHYLIIYADEGDTEFDLRGF